MRRPGSIPPPHRCLYSPVSLRGDTLWARTGATMSRISDAVPPALLEMRTRPLFTMRLTVDEMLVVGATPTAHRQVGLVTGGRFEGERLSGDVLGGGSDWQALRSDGSTRLDVRLHLRTDDGALILVRYRGLRHGPAEVMQRIATGEAVDPGEYYFRINPMFETASEAYGWLNRILAIGTGHRLSDGPIYNVFEVL